MYFRVALLFNESSKLITSQIKTKKTLTLPGVTAIETGSGPVGGAGGVGSWKEGELAGYWRLCSGGTAGNTSCTEG